MYISHESCTSKMSGRAMEAELCVVTASSSSGNMASHGEGIYASSTSADVGIQDSDQIGLTLSPKIRSGKRAPHDTCVIADLDFHEASNHLGSLSGGINEWMSFCRPEPIYGACLPIVSPPSKKRRLAGRLAEASCPRLNSIAANGSPSPKPSMQSLDSVRLCAMSWEHGDENGGSGLECSEVPLLPPGNRPACISAHQENLQNFPLSNDIPSSTEEINPTSIAFMSNQDPRTGGHWATATMPNSYTARNNFQIQGIKHSDNPSIPTREVQPQSLGSPADPSPGRAFWDPDVPMQSAERENQDLGVCHLSGMQNRENLTRTRNPASHFSSRLSRRSNGTMLQATNLAAKETTRDYRNPQGSVPPSIHPLQSSALEPCVTRLYEKYQQAILAWNANHLSSQHIPPNLRVMFEATFQKVQTDQDFRHCVTRFMMEAIGDIQADDETPHPLYPKLKGWFQTLVRKYHDDDQFRMSADKYLLEVRAAMGELEADVSSKTMNKILQDHEQRHRERPQSGLRLATPNREIPSQTDFAQAQEDCEWDASSLFSDHSPSTRAQSMSNLGQVTEPNRPQYTVGQSGAGAISVSEQPFEQGRDTMECAAPSWRSKLDTGGNVLPYSTSLDSVVDSFSTFNTSSSYESQLHDERFYPQTVVNEPVFQSMKRIASVIESTVHPIASELLAKLDPNNEAQVPESTVADQSAEDAAWAEAAAEFMRESDCSDHAAESHSQALEERSEGNGEVHYDDRDMAVVVATSAAAEESEESEEE